MDEVATAQAAVARRDFLGGLLRRLALCALLFIPLVGLFAIVNMRNSLAVTALYVGYLLAFIFILSAAFDSLEYFLTRLRIGRAAPAGQGEKICYAVRFEKDGRAFRKRYGMLVRAQAGVSFWDAHARSALALGEPCSLRAEESGKFYLRDPYSWRKRQMRALVELSREGSSWVFDVLAPLPVLERIGAGKGGRA